MSCLIECIGSISGEEGGVGGLSYRVGRLIGYRVDPGSLRYEVQEPRPAPDELLEYVLDRARSLERELSCSDVLEIAKSVVRELGANVDIGSLFYHALKALSPWGFLYPIVVDPLVEEVSVTAGEAVRVVHRRAPSVEYLETNIEAPGEHEFRAYLQQLAAAAGTAVTPAFPVAEAELCGARLTMVYGTIARSSHASIRLQPARPLSLEDLIESGMLSREAAGYLLEVLRNRGMVFIVGPQGTGKTTLLNALLEKLPRDWKLVVVEDVPELRPRHPHFVSLRVRRVRSLAESRGVELDYQDLLRVALRLRGQFTGITEARGREILDLFEAAALGEASAATFHARDWRELRLRLLKLGVREDMLSLLWSVVILGKVDVGGALARRVIAIYEVDEDGRERILYHYDPSIDRLVRLSEPRRMKTLEPHVDATMGAEEAVKV